MVSSYFVPIIIVIAITTFVVWYSVIGSPLNFAIIASVAVLAIVWIGFGVLAGLADVCLSGVCLRLSR